MKAPCLTFPPGWFEEALLGSLGRPFVCFAGVGTDAGGCRCFSPAPAVVVSILTVHCEVEERATVHEVYGAHGSARARGLKAI